MKITQLKLSAKIKSILLNSVWISCICFNLNGQSPQNWINPYPYKGILGQQVNTILHVDSTLWVFCGRNVFEVADIQKPPRIISTLDIYKPIIDRDKNVYFFKKDTVFVSSFNDFMSGNISRYFVLKYGLIPSCLQKGYSDRANITCIAIDPNGSYIWIGSEYHGIFKIRKPDWKLKFWIPTCESYYSNKNCEHGQSKQDIISNQIKVLQFDSHDRLWIGFNLGLMVLEKNRFETLLPYHTVHAITEDKKNRCIWLVAQGKGLGNQIFVFWDDMRENWDDYYKSSTIQIWTEFEFDQINNILLDHDGDLWGAANRLMREKKLGAALSSKEDLENKVKHGISQYFSYYEELTSKPLCFAEDHDGIIWIGTSSEGLFTLDKKPGLRIEQKKIVKCHNDKNASFIIKPVEGKSPYKLYWTSSHNGSGEEEDFEFRKFVNLAADTFYFRLTDRILIDTGYFRLTFDNPKPINAKIRKEADPSYQNTTDGVISITNLKGGRVKRDEFQKLKGYMVKINEFNQLVDTLPHLGLGPFKLTIVDTMGCEFVLKDTFSKTQHCFTPTLNKKFISQYFLFSEHKSYVDLNKEGNSIFIENIVKVLNECPYLKVNIEGFVALKYPPDEQAKRNNLSSAKELTLARAVNVGKILQTNKVPIHRINCSGKGERKGAFVMVYFSN